MVLLLLFILLLILFLILVFILILICQSAPTKEVGPCPSIEDRWDTRCRQPGLPGVASSKSTSFRPPEARAARDHTSPTRKSTRTHRYDKLRSGKTSAPGRRRPPPVPAGSGTWDPTRP